MNPSSSQRRDVLKKLLCVAGMIVVWPFKKSRSEGSAVSKNDSTGMSNAATPDIDPSTTVSVVPCTTYDTEAVYLAVRKSLDDIGFQVPRGKRILLKPNIMAQNTPDQAASTHPAVVEALCRIFSLTNCTITIGDSSAFYQGGGTLRGMETTGMAAVAAKYNAKLLPFEKASLRKITSGKVLNPLWITGAVFEHDLVVDVPKLKIHQIARYSGAIKNMYGCVPGGTKQLYHEMFQNQPNYKEFWGGPITDVYQAASPHLAVMDAVYGLDKDGPAADGEPRLTGVILASANGVMLDVAVCTMIGFDPQWVPAVRTALGRGLADAKNLRLVGQLPRVPYVKLPDQKSSKAMDYLFHQVIMKPVVKISRCKKGCTACKDICTPGAISLNARQLPVIDYTRCIRCYRCAEQCPFGAIRLQGGIINHTIRAARKILKI